MVESKGVIMLVSLAISLVVSIVAISLSIMYDVVDISKLRLLSVGGWVIVIIQALFTYFLFN